MSEIVVEVAGRGPATIDVGGARGVTGASAAQALYDAGLIDAPTTAAMDARYATINLAAAASAGSAAGGSAGTTAGSSAGAAAGATSGAAAGTTAAQAVLVPAQQASASAAADAGIATAAALSAQSSAGTLLLPARKYGIRSAVLDSTLRPESLIVLDGSATDNLHLYTTVLYIPGRKYFGGTVSDVTVDSTLRPTERVDDSARINGSFSGSFTPDNPAPMTYIDGGLLYAAGVANPVAGGATLSGAALTFKGMAVEGSRVRVAAARGAAVEAMYFDVATGKGGFYDPRVVVAFIPYGQSLSCGTRGRYPKTLLAKLLRLRMPRMATGVSDVRCGQWPEIGRSTAPAFAPVDPNTIVGDTEAQPQSYPYGTNQAFGETAMERMTKVVSDGWFAVTGRRQEMLLLSLGVGTATQALLAKNGPLPSPWPASNPANVYAGWVWDLNIYSNAMARIARMRDLYAAQGKRLLVAGVLHAQGESDASDPTWATKFNQLVPDFNADVKAITGQTFTPVWMQTQVTAVGSGTAGYTFSQRGQVAAHVAELAHIVEPQYAGLPRGAYGIAGDTKDYVHKDAIGYALNGERAGQAMLQIFATNTRPKIVRPLSVAQVDAVTFDVLCEVPVGPLVLDDNPGFPVPANYGVSYSDTGGTGSAPSVSSVAVRPDGVTLRIVLSVDSAGRAGRRINFGENGPIAGSGAAAGSSTPFSPSTMPRLAIHDSATAVSEVDGQTNINWFIHASILIS